MKNTRFTRNAARKVTAVALAGALSVSMLTALTACGETASTGEGSSEATPTEVYVGSGNVYSPFCYVDDAGNPQGYEYAVLQAVDERLDQYTFTYEPQDFTNILTGLDAGKIDLAAHQYEWNEERAENYEFGDVGYTSYDIYIVVTDDDKYNLSSCTTYEEELQILGEAGARVQAPAGSNNTAVLEKWNSEHPDAQVELDYTQSATTDESIASIENGVYDFLLITKYDTAKYNELLDSSHQLFVPVDEYLSSSDTKYLYRKNDEASAELKAAVDGALQELIDDGTLSAISEEYLGGDYTPAARG